MEMEMELLMDFLCARTPPPSSAAPRVVDGVPLAAPRLTTAAAANMQAATHESAIPVSYLQAFQSAAVPAPYPQSTAASAITTPSRWPSTPQLTIFYAGFVHVFDNVTREHAEQIMFMAAQAAAGSPPAAGLPMPVMQPESAALPDETRMAIVGKACSDPLPLSPLDAVSQAVFMQPRDVPLARNASLARFLERRKRSRVTRPAVPYYRWERSPGKPGAASRRRSAEATAPCTGSTPERPWFFTNARGRSTDEEALDTELKI